MSVPVGQRGKSKLDAHTKTEELVLHTLTITSNPNVFLDRNQALTKLVNECAVGIGRDVWQANLVRVGSDPRKWAHRRELQERACEGFTTLLYYIGLSIRANHLRRGKRRLYALESQGLRPEGTTRTSYEGWRAHAAKGDNPRLLENSDEWFKRLEWS